MNSAPVSRSQIRLQPVSGGTIFIFNTTQQGMFQTVVEQINNLTSALEKDKIPGEPEFFIVFGPFDNVIRFEVDDFCLVNKISSLAGISSQQIQCAYKIWDSTQLTNNPGKEEYRKPLCCLTQLKIQNHLMLGCGLELEEASYC